jgi:hypothetical protein
MGHGPMGVSGMGARGGVGGGGRVSSLEAILIPGTYSTDPGNILQFTLAMLVETRISIGSLLR